MIFNNFIILCDLVGFDLTNEEKIATFLEKSDRLVLNYQAQKDAGVKTDLTDAEYSELQGIRARCIKILKGETNE